MIGRYRTNNQKYQDIIYKVNNLEIKEELKKKIIGIIQKYKISILCMEEAEVNTLVEQCIESKNIMPIQSELHYILTGRTKSLDNKDSKITKKDIEDECYLD